ncbi:CLUMA_CG019848, isoform A [Clunio marinus]|uniref:CLUMA_CG019848, isoform A n=1 Tax=Clunio marinus TaxID=568069 RepID=A0A1J1J295_9DIPT|nr:CLUMA_CG019848, isoform A [Clunio marinus]
MCQSTKRQQAAAAKCQKEFSISRPTDKNPNTKTANEMAINLVRTFFFSLASFFSQRLKANCVSRHNARRTQDGKKWTKLSIRREIIVCAQRSQTIK